jgi:Predicted metal-dependent hydrolase of the TIM-barrel fold
MLIDMHTHLFPDGLAKRALNNIAQITGCAYHTDGTLNDTVHKMHDWGVDRFVALNIATKPKQQTTINDWAASIQNEMICCFGSVHPDAPDAPDELARIRTLGLPGVKLHPDYQDFLVDDPKMFPIYDAISELGLLVTFHAGKDPFSPDLVHASPAALNRIAERFPKMKIIAAHMGGMVMYPEVEESLVGKNIFFDTSMSSVLCPPEWFERIVRKHGSERILFGSDCPWSRSCDEFDYIERSSLSSKEKENIYWRNAARLLQIDD